MPSMIMGIANCWCLFVNDYTENAKFIDNFSYLNPLNLRNAQSSKLRILQIILGDLNYS